MKSVRGRRGDGGSGEEVGLGGGELGLDCINILVEYVSVLTPLA